MNQSFAQNQSLGDLDPLAKFDLPDAALTEEHASLAEFRLNSIQLSFESDQIEAMLGRENRSDFLPREFAKKLQDIAMQSGLGSVEIPTNRVKLKKLCDKLEERIVWLDKKIQSIDKSERPTAISREEEQKNCISTASLLYQTGIGSLISVVGFAAGILTSIGVGIVAHSFSLGIVSGLIVGASALYIWLKQEDAEVQEAKDKFEERERNGETAYQEPVNAQLLEIYRRDQETPFPSDRERRISLQNDLLAFQRSLELTQNNLRGVTTDLHALGMALKHSSAVSINLFGDRQAKEAIKALKEAADESARQANIIRAALTKLVQHEEFSVDSSSLSMHLEVIEKMRGRGQFKNSQLESEFQSLLEDVAARTEL